MSLQINLDSSFKSQENSAFLSLPLFPKEIWWLAHSPERGYPGLAPAACVGEPRKTEAFVLSLKGNYLLGRKELALVEGKTLNFPSPGPSNVLVFCILGSNPAKILLRFWSLPTYSWHSLWWWFYSKWDVTLATNLPSHSINPIPLCNQYSLAPNHFFALTRSCSSSFRSTCFLKVTVFSSSEHGTHLNPTETLSLGPWRLSS